VIELGRYAGKVADTIAVGVAEGGRIDLVEASNTQSERADRCGNRYLYDIRKIDDDCIMSMVNNERLPTILSISSI